MTIRRPDEFPNVDDMLNRAAGPQPVLDYRGDNGDAAHRDITPALVRLVFAGGMAALFGGFGYVLARDSSQQTGAVWMAIGAAVLGLIIPIPGSRRRGGNLK